MNRPNQPEDMQAFPSAWSGGMNMVCYYAGLLAQGYRASGATESYSNQLSSDELARRAVDDARALVAELQNRCYLDPWMEEVPAITPPPACVRSVGPRRGMGGE